MIFIVLIVISFGAGFVCAASVYKKEKRVEIENMSEQYNKLFLYFRILNMWLEMRQKGKSTVTYLQKKGIGRPNLSVSHFKVSTATEFAS